MINRPRHRLPGLSQVETLQPNCRKRLLLRREQQMVPQEVTLFAKGTFGRHPRNLGVIVLLRQVRQYEELGASIIVA